MAKWLAGIAEVSITDTARKMLFGRTETECGAAPWDIAGGECLICLEYGYVLMHTKRNNDQFTNRDGSDRGKGMVGLSSNLLPPRPGWQVWAVKR